MAKVTVNHVEYEFSHGKRAKGRGQWVFSTTRNADVDDMFFDCEHDTVSNAAKRAAKFFNVTEVFVQP